MIMGVRESATRRIAASQADVFGLVTDPGRLPAWNRAIAEVVEAPDHLEVGSVWKVRVHALGNSWVSRSEVAELDPAQGRFAYRSQTDDGNPSHADWQWTVRPGEDGEGSEVTVSVDLVLEEAPAGQAPPAVAARRDGRFPPTARGGYPWSDDAGATDW